MREVVQREIEAHVKNIRYAKVIMSLADIIDGDFFTTYVKKGVCWEHHHTKRRCETQSDPLFCREYHDVI